MPDVPVVYEACPGYPEALGCVSEGIIYVQRRGDHETLPHELGQVWASLKLTPADYPWFARRLGARGMLWDTGPGPVSPIAQQHRHVCATIYVLDLLREAGWRRPGR